MAKINQYYRQRDPNNSDLLSDISAFGFQIDPKGSQGSQEVPLESPSEIRKGPKGTQGVLQQTTGSQVPVP